MFIDGSNLDRITSINFTLVALSVQTFIPLLGIVLQLLVVVEFICCLQHHEAKVCFRKIKNKKDILSRSVGLKKEDVLKSSKMESGSWRNCCQSGVNPTTPICRDKPGSKLEIKGHNEILDQKLEPCVKNVCVHFE